MCRPYGSLEAARANLFAPKYPFSDQFWTRVVFDNINNSSGWPTLNNAKDSREHYANIKTQSKR